MGARLRPINETWSQWMMYRSSGLQLTICAWGEHLIHINIDAYDMKEVCYFCYRHCSYHKYSIAPVIVQHEQYCLLLVTFE